ncbi:conserved oligomeric Golgi complex subunit 3 [Rhizoctonia solani]|uniref:Conserved oligomeric Golgi complex subunit 3 n=1 Tax=Rhizoctonia solani TaxID=456999 RepID=A0A8H8SYP1_9AGAM|nr:conserved oligomeric Golgi complex subunit 3 [Rhizoctonia solani]QRW21538.1 conserved oligomeric Golgi complex subunit 3 [Rhizoctonia solani]
MATVRPGIRRPNITTTGSHAPSPHAKPALTVEEWETKAPLDDVEVRSVLSLKIRCEEKKPPLKFREEDSPSRPSTPILGRHGGLFSSAPGSRSATPVPMLTVTRDGTSHPLHPQVPLETPQQFHDWFALIDRSITYSQESHFRSHLQNVEAQLVSCDNLLDRVHGASDDLTLLHNDWQSVEDRGESLKGAAQRLLEERDRLIKVTDAIGEALVLQTDFLLMVERVDVCLEYMKTHRHFKEAEIYLLRFQQCLTRAMTLIKMYLVGTLRAIHTDVQKRTIETDISSTAAHHLLYTKFQSLVPSISPLVMELENRAISHPDQLESLLSECHTAYFSVRRALLVPRVTEEIRGLQPGQSELIELTRVGCTYLKQVCTEEFNLFRRFFNSGEDKLYRYLEGICDHLYDDLRPRILHEQKLDVLCEVCTVLQALMVLDIPLQSFGDSGAPPPTDEDPLQLTTSPTLEAYDLQLPPRTPGLAKLHISHLLQMVLQDAQTRLFFKAQAIVQSEIRNYAAQPKDLDYPAKLRDVAAFVQPEVSDEDEEDDGITLKMPKLEPESAWYPPLLTTVNVLKKLHEYVKPAIFQDISQEAISLCRISILSAADLILARPESNDIDAHLFVIRHLLVLKEITTAVENATTDYEVASQPASDTLGNLLRGTSSLFNPTGLLGGMLGPSRYGESLPVARTTIDEDLKRSCESLITKCAELATAPLKAFIAACDNFTRSQPDTLLSTQEFAQLPGIVKAQDEFRSVCETQLSQWATHVRLYLRDENTISVLLPAMYDEIASVFTAFRKTAETRCSPGCGISLMSLPDLWEWLRSLQVGVKK